MSGWIKIEKDLANDPRVLRMASRLRHADVTLGSRSRLVVVGALVTLWWYADTHIREDDVLPIGADQIDELVGIANFCDLMPTEWLQVLDPNSVKLVDYLQHNGTSAKKRAVDQKRQQRHRDHNAPVTVESRSSHVNGVTRPRPREDLDQEKTKEVRGDARGEPRAARSAVRLPEDFGMTEDRKAYAEALHIDPTKTLENFRDYWSAASGAKARKHDWDATWRMWCRNDADRKKPEPKTARTIKEIMAGHANE